MLKLLLCSAIFAPCCIMPFVGFGSSELPNYETGSFEDVHIQPALERLENCESAELGVFFHEAYIESHSADFVGEGIQMSSSCNNPTYVVQPLISSSLNVAEQEAIHAQTEELLLVLKAYGVNAEVGTARNQEESGALFMDGQTAIVKIIINGRGNA